MRASLASAAGGGPVPLARSTLAKVVGSDTPEYRLEEAIGAVPGQQLLDSLAAVVRAVPIPLGVDFAAIRLRAADREREFYLLAMEGGSPYEITRRALEPFPLAVIRSAFALGVAHSASRTMGLRWAGGRWLMLSDEPIGALLAGSRTERRPDSMQEKLFTQHAEHLSQRLKSVDRSTATLELHAASLAKDAVADPAGPPSPALEGLRPRERTILALYAEGLSAEDIAKMLFISPHTVRTHVKNAFRRLGIHSRNEAAELVHTDELARLV
jgi:DNA-binding CsgD family transcriptional regulator